MQVLQYNIDDVITILLEEKNPQSAHITKIYAPNLVPLCGFTIPLQQLYKEDLYVARFQLPKDSQSGTYIIFVEWDDENNNHKQQIYQIIISKLKNQNVQMIMANGI